MASLAEQRLRSLLEERGIPRLNQPAPKRQDRLPRAPLKLSDLGDPAEPPPVTSTTAAGMKLSDLGDPVEAPPTAQSSMAATVGEGVTEFGKAVPRGTFGALATGMKGLAAKDRTTEGAITALEAELPRVPQMSDEEFASFLAEAGRTLPRGAAMRFQSNAQMIRQGKIAPDQGHPVRDVTTTAPIQDSPIYQAGERLEEQAGAEFPADPEWQESLTLKVGEGFGSTIPFLIAGMGGGTALGVAFGSMMSSGEAIDRAVQGGASPEDILQAAKLGQIPGLTEQVPIELLMERIPLPAMGPVMGAIGRIGAQVLAEGGQEAAQEFVQNLIERYVYDPDQDLTEGVMEAGLVGGIVGGGMGAVKEGGRAALGTPEAPTPAAPGREAPEPPPPLQGEPFQVPPQLEAEIAGELAAEQMARPVETQIGAPDTRADSAAMGEPAAAEPPAAEPLPPQPAVAPETEFGQPEAEFGLDALPPDQVAMLRAAGYSDQDIADMTEASREANVAEAVEQGVTPRLSDLGVPAPQPQRTDALQQDVQPPVVAQPPSPPPEPAQPPVVAQGAPEAPVAPSPVAPPAPQTAQSTGRDVRLPIPPAEERVPQVAQPPVQTLAQFAAERGLTTDADVQGHLHAGLRSAPQTKTYRRFNERKLTEMQDARDETVRLYREALERGEIRAPSETDRLQAAAAGHPDNQSTQAAQRVLAKRAARIAQADVTTAPEAAAVVPEAAETPASEPTSSQRLSDLGDVAPPAQPSRARARRRDRPRDLAAANPERQRQAALTPAAQAKRVDIEKRATDLISRIAGKEIQVRFHSEGVRPEGAAERAALRRSGGDTEAAGYYMPSGPLIGLSLSINEADVLPAAAHEAFHHLDRSGFLNEAERKVMEREEPRLLDMAEEEIGTRDLPRHEIRAYAFQRYYRHGGAGMHIGVRRVFEKIARLVRALRNYLKGLGFQTADDVFGRALSGEMERRGGTAPDGGPSFAGVRRRHDPDASFRAPGDPAALKRFLLGRVFARFGGVPFTNRDLRFHLQDRMIDMRRYQEAVEEAQGGPLAENYNVYLAEELYHGKTGARLERLRREFIDPIQEKMKTRGAEISAVELGEYLYARHASERNRELRKINPEIESPSGMSDAEAKAIMDTIGKDKRAPVFRELANLVDEMVRQTRERLLRDDLISQEMHDEWAKKYRNYVPLRGFEDDPSAAGDMPAVGRGLDIRGPEAKRALGRESRADNPLLYTVAQAEQAIVRGEKNRVLRTLLRLVNAFPNRGVWEVNKAEIRQRLNEETGLVEAYAVPPAFVQRDNIFGVKVGGKMSWIVIHDPKLARDFRRLGTEHLQALIHGLGKLNRMLSRLHTSLNPAFWIPNFFRDLMTGMVHLSELTKEAPGIRRKVLRDIPGAMRGVYGGVRGKEGTDWQRWFREFNESGGKISFFDIANVETQRARINKALTQGRLRSALSGVNEAVENINAAVENAIRLATYKNLREAGASRAMAASAARNLTVNFNRRGEFGATLNSLYLFYNAAIQGNVRLLQAISRSKVARRAVYGMIGAGFLLDIMNYLVAGEDDDEMNYWDKLPDWEKERNLVIMEPGTGNATKVPLPYGYNVAFVLGQNISAVMRANLGLGAGKEPTKAAADIASAFTESFIPISFGANVGQFLSPTFSDPFLEIWQNENWFGGPVKPKQYDDLEPESNLHFRSVAPWAKQLAQALNAMSGGNEFKPGAIDHSPEVYEHLWDFYLGGAGKFWGDQVPTFLWGLATGEEVETFKIPLYSKVRTSISDYVNSGIYYDLRDQVQIVENQLKGFSAAGDSGRVESVREGNPVAASVIGAFDAAEKQLRKMRKAKRAIEASDMPGDKKKERLDGINADMEKVMTTARRKWEEARRAHAASRRGGAQSSTPAPGTVPDPALPGMR